MDRKLIALFVGGSMLAGCLDNAATPAVFEDSGADKLAERFSPTTTLAGLAADASETPHLIVQDVRVGGVVSSSDAAGNFYQSLVFQDTTGAAELLVGLYDLHRDYPPGAHIAVRMRGLAVARRRGVLQIGRMPLTGDFSVEPLATGSADVVSQYVQFGFQENQVQPVSRLIKTLTDDDCGRLVRIGALRLILGEAAETGDTGTNREWAGYRVFMDADSAKIRSYTSEYSLFALKEIPNGSIALTGILQKEPAGEATYVIKLRDEADCE